MANHLAVVLSEGQSNSPTKRRLEEAIVAELTRDAQLDVIVVPHLVDLRSDDPAVLALQRWQGDLVVLSWLYPRAAHWTLDRHNVRGRVGETSFSSDGDLHTAAPGHSVRTDSIDPHTPRVVDQRPLPARCIYHLDLRTSENPRVLIDEVRRIASELSQRVVSLSGTLGNSRCATDAPGGPSQPAITDVGPTDVRQTPSRRWYPVIDYGRCTNCMECIDFCLFGVYGVDSQETILVEQPDNCRKGCPACSRVCPENAIMFPQHKTPVIAGAAGPGSELKIDLSQLFGKPADLDVATRERDEHLRLAGRDPVGAGAADSAASSPPAVHRDELDDLIDELDQADL